MFICQYLALRILKWITIKKIKRKTKLKIKLLLAQKINIRKQIHPKAQLNRIKLLKLKRSKWKLSRKCDVNVWHVQLNLPLRYFTLYWESVNRLHHKIYADALNDRWLIQKSLLLAAIDALFIFCFVIIVTHWLIVYVWLSCKRLAQRAYLLLFIWKHQFCKTKIIFVSTQWTKFYEYNKWGFYFFIGYKRYEQ